MFAPQPSLKCAVCAQMGHGMHFGVASCRPCAAFFRRCIFEKRIYKCLRGTNNCNIQLEGNRKACKGCRMRVCLLVGMSPEAVINRIQQKAETSSARPQSVGTTDDEVPFPTISSASDGFRHRLRPSLLTTLTDAYRTLTGTHTNQITEIVPQQIDFYWMEQRTKAMFFTIFNDLVEPFYRMENELKIKLMCKVFHRLYFLHCCHLTMEHIADQMDTRILIGIGQMFDIRRLGEIVTDWKAEEQLSKMMSKCHMLEKVFKFIQMTKEMPTPILPPDFCALMAVGLWNSAKQLSEEVPYNAAEWDDFKETILTDWHHLLIRSDPLSAASQMGRLLCSLVELEAISSTKFDERNCWNFAVRINSNSEQQSITQTVPMAALELFREENELQYLVRLVNAHHRIWGAFSDLPEYYTNKYGTFEDLISSTENILGKFESFTLDPRPMNGRERAAFFREVEELGTVQKHPRIQKSILVFRLISVGIAKAMPIFRLLALEDQMILTRSLAQPINFFVNGFYSAQLGSNTWKGKDGIISLDIYRAIPRFKDDLHLLSWAEKSLSRSVGMFIMYSIPRLDEFTLLLAILFCHSAISELSAHAKGLLCAEQKRYSSQLLHLLQNRLGAAQGAVRYADYMLLIESAFYSSNNYQMFITYQETVYLREDYRNVFPQNVKQIII